jgi:hypothetical protein
VINHYRHGLATHNMPPAERDAVLGRIARIEDEIQTLAAAGEIRSRLTYSQAA